MKYVGVDLHKKTISVCVVGQAREVLASRRLFCDDEERIAAFFAAHGRHAAVVEATASYEWFVRLIEPLAERVVLAHPGKLRVIAESTRKSDKLDARVLAEFLALGMIPAAHRPTPRVRAHRSLVRHRQHLQQRITATKTQLRRILSDYNADRPDLFTNIGRAALAGMELTPTDRFRCDELSGLLDFLTLRLQEANGRLRRFAGEAAEPEQRARRLLRSIPGVGEVTSEVVLAELGDVGRFRSAKQAVRYDPRWRGVFERLARRTGKKKAITAVARRLLTVMVALLKSGEPYRTAAA